METTDTGRWVERMAMAARAIERFATWGAGAALVIGVGTFLSPAPWLRDDHGRRWLHWLPGVAARA